TQYIAALRLSNATLYFAHWETEDGHVPSTAVMTEDEIKAAGVDGCRYLDDHREYPEFTATTLEDTTSYAGAVALAGVYWLAKSKMVQLAIVVGGSTVVYRYVHVVDVRPKAHAGPLGGFGASVGSAAHVAATWKFRLLSNQ
nr:hypothetical protein [Propionibacteriales bacterium]